MYETSERGSEGQGHLGHPAGLSICLLHLLIHAPIKALLFICAGEIYHQSHSYNLQKISLRLQDNKALLTIYLLASAALIGIPPFSGFFSELYLALIGTQTQNYFIVFFALASSLLTAVYLLRIPKYLFFQNKQSAMTALVKNQKIFRPSTAMYLSLAAIFLQSLAAVPAYQYFLSFWKGG